MGIYLGFVQTFDVELYNGNLSKFFNFNPTHELIEGNLHELTDQDVERLLPESYNSNINLSYNNRDDIYYNIEDMRERFDDETLYFFNFELEDLEDNINARGERNKTGYKINARAAIEANKLMEIHRCGFYQIVRIKGNSANALVETAAVDINSIGLVKNIEVLVEKDGFLAGPYKVGYRPSRMGVDASYYVTPKIKENKYLMPGFDVDECKKYSVTVSFDNYDNDTENIIIAQPLNNEKTSYIDVITDEQLIEAFKEVVSKDHTKNGFVNMQDTSKILDLFKDSSLVGDGIPKDVSESRLGKLTNILTSESLISESMSELSETICDLIVNHNNGEMVNDLIEKIIEVRPDFLNEMKDNKLLISKRNKLESDIEKLQQQKDAIEEDFHNLELEAYEKAKDEKDGIISSQELDEEFQKKKEELEKTTGLLGVATNIADLQKRLDELTEETNYLEDHKSHLKSDTTNLESDFINLISNQHERMTNIAFDGFMANRMLSASAKWETEDQEKHYLNSVKKINRIEVAEKSPDEIINYLCRTIQTERPSYDKNTIINIAICMTQGFLTVFSGEPGCGKTSICNIFSKALGLDKIGQLIDRDEYDVSTFSRYVPVSVERGWTSKRDFVGYYNPLSKTFDNSNMLVYDALKQLDTEKKENISKFPFVILLDEANLSPMEYYWADFMNICDGVSDNSYINLGNDNVLLIPDTLHFVATINNDHTTETLSPRLIDRAWIINLPSHDEDVDNSRPIRDPDVDMITWSSLKKAFSPDSIKSSQLGLDASKTYKAVKEKFAIAHIAISPRTDLAIKKYVSVAANYFEADSYETEPYIIALDYAVAQKILPKINGGGEDFEEWLEGTYKLFAENGLEMSARTVREIIDRGNMQMKYYQYFA